MRAWPEQSPGARAVPARSTSPVAKRRDNSSRQFWSPAAPGDRVRSGPDEGPLTHEVLIEKPLRLFQPWGMNLCLVIVALAVAWLLSGCEKNGAQTAKPLAALAETNAMPIHYYLDHAQPKL